MQIQKINNKKQPNETTVQILRRSGPHIYDPGGGGGGGGGGGDSHMKWTRMLVVSLRGVNLGFWSRLGCSGQNVIIFSHQGLV